MGDATFIHDSAGYVELMKSDAMRSVLRGYGEGILSTASGSISEDKGTPLKDDPYEMHDFTGRDRAGVRISTTNDHSIYAEAKHGHLQSAAGV